MTDQTDNANAARLLKKEQRLRSLGMAFAKMPWLLSYPMLEQWRMLQEAGVYKKSFTTYYNDFTYWQDQYLSSTGASTRVTLFWRSMETALAKAMEQSTEPLDAAKILDIYRKALDQSTKIGLDQTPTTNPYDQEFDKWKTEQQQLKQLRKLKKSKKPKKSKQAAATASTSTPLSEQS